MIEGVDYSIEESASEDFDYKISLIEEQVLWNVGLQVWNIAMGAQTYGAVSVALSNLNNDGISGDAEVREGE